MHDAEALLSSFPLLAPSPFPLLTNTHVGQAATEAAVLGEAPEHAVDFVCVSPPTVCGVSPIREEHHHGLVVIVGPRLRSHRTLFPIDWAPAGARPPLTG